MRSVAVLKGVLTADAAGILFGHQLEMVRNELLQFIRPELMNRFADEVHLYFEGVEMESPFRNESRYPSVEELIRFRRQSVCMYPFFALIEVETGVHLPDEVYYHPHVRRLSELASDMIARYNDAQSLFKDETTGDGVFTNLITVIQHNNKISRQQAVDKFVNVN